MVKLKSPLRKFYGRHQELVDRYGIIVFTDNIGYVTYVVTTIPFPFMNVTYRLFTGIFYNMSNTTGATRGAGFAYPSGAHGITASFWWGSCCLFFSFLCCVMCTIVCLFVFFHF